MYDIDPIMFISKVNFSASPINLDDLDKNLDAAKSRLKNLDQEKKKLISTVEKISTL